MYELLGSIKDQESLERILRALVQIPEYKLPDVAGLLELILKMQ